MTCLSNIEKKDIEYASSIIRNKLFNNNFSDLKNPFEIISNLNNYIIIRFPSKLKFEAETENLSGFSYNISEYKCIYINSNHLLARQFFSCWHEFYHTLNDDNSQSYNIKKEELKADYFASCILMPKNEIENYFMKIGKGHSELEFQDLVLMQHHFRVSLSALVKRISDIYSINKYNHYLKYRLLKYNDELINKTLEIKKNGNRDIDINLIKPTEDFVLPKKFLDSTMNNIENDRITLDKANSILSLIEEKEVKFLW